LTHELAGDVVADGKAVLLVQLRFGFAVAVAGIILGDFQQSFFGGGVLV